jgi:hypothetical protein
MHCVKCGAAVPEGAAFCPSCGSAAGGGGFSQEPVQPAPKKGSKLLGCFAAVIGIIVLLVIIGSLAPDPSTGNSTAAEGGMVPNGELPLEVTATQLFGAYENNEASAQSYFGDRKLLVSGTVDKVMLDFTDDPIVLLRTPNQFMSVQAALADDAKGEAGNFSRGDKAKLLCENISEVIGTPMLKDCRAAPAGIKGQPVQWADEKK